MSEWQEIKLGEALNFYNGKTIDYTKGGEYPVFGSNGQVGLSSKYKYENVIILGRVGAYCGAVFYIKEKCWATDNTIVVKAKNNTDIKFLYYLLNVLNLNNFAGGSAQPLLTQGWLKPIKIKLPSLPTQQKIAKILSNYDDLIENNLKRIKLLEESARLTYEEWFLRFRVDGKKLEIDPESGFPFGWMRKKAEEVLNVNIGKTPPRGESHWFTSGGQGMKWISIKDMKQSSTYTFNSNEEITKDGVTKHNMNIAQVGVVLLSFKLTVGEVRITVNDVVTNEAIAHMNIKKDSVLFNEYIYSYLQSFNFDTLGSTSSIGTAINSKIVKAIPIVIPSNEILEKFKINIVPTFSEINNLQEQNQLLKEARDILLPRLMTGMIDVEKMSESGFTGLGDKKD